MAKEKANKEKYKDRDIEEELKRLRGKDDTQDEAGIINPR